MTCACGCGGIFAASSYKYAGRVVAKRFLLEHMSSCSRKTAVAVSNGNPTYHVRLKTANKLRSKSAHWRKKNKLVLHKATLQLQKLAKQGMLKGRRISVLARNTYIANLRHARRKMKHTRPELLMARILRHMGVHYKSQQRLLDYIPDFVLPGSNAIIEVNGVYWHSRPGMHRKDNRKRRVFKRAGYKVLYVKDTTVAQRPRFVIWLIRKYLL